MLSFYNKRTLIRDRMCSACSQEAVLHASPELKGEASPSGKTGGTYDAGRAMVRSLATLCSVRSFGIAMERKLEPNR